MTNTDRVKRRVLLTRQERDDCYKEWQDTNNTLFEIMCKKQIQKTLADPDIMVRSENQELPKRGINVCANCWITTQQDMLKDGWIKCEPKEAKRE